MKKLLMLCLLVLTLGNLIATTDSYAKITRYAGKNADALINYIDNLTGLKAQYADFILTHISHPDLAVITPDYFDEHLTYALKSLDLPYVAEVPEEYFLHFILPLRISQEPFENWRKEFYETLLPQVEKAKDINEAIMFADLFYQEGVYFKQTSGRDQAPLTSIKRGYGRCEEMMILQMAIFRSVGIPCRPASAPYWSFTDSNHVWTEVWTPEGWKIVPEGYPAEYRKSSWEIDRAKKAPLLTSEVFGTYNTPLTLEKNQHDTKLNITNVYADIVKTTVLVVDEENNPVPEANVYYYATTFGGLFNLFSDKTDDEGKLNVDFGNTSLFVTAGKAGKVGKGYLNTLQDITTTTIMLKKDNNLEANFVMNFPLDSSENRDFGISEMNNQYIQDKTDLANKKRETRLLNQKKSIQFLTNYPLPEPKEDTQAYLAKREKYLAKCERLAGNADNWLVADNSLTKLKNHKLARTIMIDIMLDWDIKDLIELPDTTAIQNLLLSLTESREYYQKHVEYDIFKANVLQPVFGSNPFPQTGWREELTQLTNSLRDKNITKTVENIQQWMKLNTFRDEQASWSYFGGSLTPTQTINKKYLTETEHIFLLSSLLQTAGIPQRWKGFLEYYNGKKWVGIDFDFGEDVTDDTPPEPERIEKEFEIVITFDGKEQTPEPFSNFLVSSISGKGLLSNTWFDFYEENGKHFAKYFQEPNSQLYVMGYIRNKNGDANVVIKQITPDSKQIELNFVTPTTQHENQIQWSAETLTATNSLLKDNNMLDKTSLLMILNRAGNEPQERMLEQLLNNLDNFKKKDIEVIVYSQNRQIPELTSLNKENFTYQNGDTIVSEPIALDNYPVIFLFKDGEIVTSANGFDLDLIGYLLRLVD